MNCVFLAGLVIDLTILSSSHKPPITSKALEPFQISKASFTQCQIIQCPPSCVNNWFKVKMARRSNLYNLTLFRHPGQDFKCSNITS